MDTVEIMVNNFDMAFQISFTVLLNICRRVAMLDHDFKNMRIIP